MQPVDIVGVDIDQERRIGVAQELKQRSDYDFQSRFLEQSRGGRKRRRDGVDERERGGDGDLADSEIAKRQVNVPHRRDEKAREARGRF